MALNKVICFLEQHGSPSPPRDPTFVPLGWLMLENVMELIRHIEKKRKKKRRRKKKDVVVEYAALLHKH